MTFEWTNFVMGGGAAIILSGIIRTMPKPEALNNNIWYKWFYDAVQYISANGDKTSWSIKKLIRNDDVSDL